MNNPFLTKSALNTDRGRAALAIVDQMVVSGTNFLMLAALGRFAGTAPLGLFSIGFSIVVIATTAIRSLSMTPYAVFAHRESDQRRSQMRTAVLLISGSTGVVCAGLGMIVSIWLMIRGNQAGQFAFAAALAIPAWSGRELARQLSFADIRFFRAIVIDGVTATVQLTMLGALIFTGQLTAFTVMAVIVVSCSGVGMAWLAAARNDFAPGAGTLRSDIVRFWRFGRWGALSQASHVAQSYSLHWVLAAFGGLSATGVFAAVWSVVQLASPFVQGAGNALTPLLAKRLSEGGRESVVHATIRFTKFAIVASIAYLTAMYLVGPHAMHLIYGPKYDNTLSTLMLLSLATSLAAAALVATKVISVLEYPQINFALNVSGLLMTTVFAAVLGYLHGIEGAAVGLVLAALIGMFTKWACYAYVINN